MRKEISSAILAAKRINIPKKPLMDPGIQEDFTWYLCTDTQISGLLLQKMRPIENLMSRKVTNDNSDVQYHYVSFIIL